MLLPLAKYSFYEQVLQFCEKLVWKNRALLHISVGKENDRRALLDESEVISDHPCTRVILCLWWGAFLP